MSDLGPGELFTGWGRATKTAAGVLAPSSQFDIERLFHDPQGTGRCCPRGLGRAYGDAAQCAGGTILDCRGLLGAPELNSMKGTVQAGGGTSLDTLLGFLVPRGYFLPVVPGTRFVTLGGAIASDIHGKNHHLDGCLSRHVENLRLVAPAGVFDCSPHQHPEEFWATCGGMGLTGVITEAAVRLVRIDTSWMIVDIERAANLEGCLSLLASDPARYRYSVAWVDGLARGKHLGRSVLTRANHAAVADLPARRRLLPLPYRSRRPVEIPLVAPFSLLNAATVSAFNELWYRKAPARRETRLEPLNSFFFPLDGVGGWNRLYGPRGFAQYQFAVPFGAEVALERVLERMSRARLPSFLAVLKSFGPPAGGPLSFPIAGWTLALDLPLGSPGLPELLDDLDDLVAGSGGRIYLSKDARLQPELLEVMYPRLGEWREVQARLDPGGMLRSDLARRLGLTVSRTLSGPGAGKGAC